MLHMGSIILLFVLTLNSATKFPKYLGAERGNLLELSFCGKFTLKGEKTKQNAAH